jgi:hypothetical protein
MFIFFFSSSKLQRNPYWVINTFTNVTVSNRLLNLIQSFIPLPCKFIPLPITPWAKPKGINRSCILKSPFPLYIFYINHVINISNTEQPSCIYSYYIYWFTFDITIITVRIFFRIHVNLSKYVINIFLINIRLTEFNTCLWVCFTLNMDSTF